VVDIISQSPRSKIFKVSSQDEGLVVWKVCGVSKNALAELSNEYRVTENLNIKGIRKAIKKGIYDNKDAFSYEYIEGSTIKALLTQNQLSSSDFLEIAIKLISIVRELHNAGYLHLRLNSNNILVNPVNREVFIIDFTIAVQGSPEKSADFKDWGSEINYIAPEQVGLNRSMIDQRSDLYSLGIIFYEMLTSTLPFSYKTHAELVHAHLIEIPAPVHQRNKGVEKVLSHIVAKLLSKDPLDRYQTAYGIEWDLISVRDQIKSGQLNELFKLGYKDQSNKLDLTAKLYNRNKELTSLEEGLKSIIRGSNSYFLIRGEAGVGKTTLVQEFEKLVRKKDGILITGTFGQFDSNLPHRGLISALKDLGTYILSQHSEKHIEWKTILNEAVGDIGQILVDLIPEFGLITEPRNELASLSGGQAQSRMNFLFQRILQEVATLNRPLVLFMDNLQWIDKASWNSISSILNDNRIKHFMFIGAYTDHASAQDVKNKNNSNFNVLHPDLKEIHLGNLLVEDIKCLVSESIRTNDPHGLSQIILAKTHGNPFYIKQFLHLIHNKKILQFNPILSQWLWDKEKIKGMHISANVIQFLTDKVRKLTGSELNVITRAACIGQSIKLQLLNKILNGSESDLGSILLNLLDEGLLESTAIGEYNFTHNQVLETAYQLGDQNILSECHFAIAEWMSNSIEKNESENVFEIASHYNRAAKKITKEQYFKVSQINKDAGVQASKTADFDLAFRYFKSAIDLLTEEDWDQHYSFVLDLYILATESGLVTGSLEDSEVWLQQSLDHARSTPDRVRIYEIKLNHLSETHQFAETVRQLLLVLDEIGYGIKRNPSKLAILKELIGVKWYLLNKKTSEIANLPTMKDENALAFMRLTVNATVSIFGHAPDILPIVFFRQSRLSLKYGNSVYAPFGYISYGFAISVFLGQVKQGYEFGRMALELVDKLNARVVKTKVMVVFHGFLAYWKDSLRSSAAPLRQAYINGRETGDLLYATFAAAFNGGVRLYSGDNLPILLESLTEDCLTIKRLNQELVYQISEVQRQYVINLVRPMKDPLVFCSDGFSEEAFFKKIKEIDDQATAFRIYNYKMALGCIFNDYKTAYVNAIEAGKFEDETNSRQIGYPSFLMFKSMAEIKLLGETEYSFKNPRKVRKSIAQKIQILEGYAKLAPQNYSNKVSFLKALKNQLDGNKSEAFRYFDLAVSESKKAGFIHEEALFREHFAYYYIDVDLPENAEMMLQKAYSCYNSWGAYSKCEHLLNKYPEIIKIGGFTEESGTSNFQNLFDLNTIISANQSLSSENNLDGLLKRTLSIFINNTSASKVVIILSDRQGILKAKALATDQNPQLLSGNETDLKFPESIINFVARSETNFVSDNFTKETKYRFDPYVQKHQPRSVCCIPILSKHILLGMVYFENNHSESAFDVKRVEFYKTICAQFAISLDNVVLYSELEDKVKERTFEIAEKNELLALEKKKSDDLLLNILPADTAQELKDYGKTTARLYNDVTVLFCDIKDFTFFAEKLSPEELINQLDICFKKFDQICQKHGIEKIKTVGDAYIAAGGIPKKNFNTAAAVVYAALDMQKFVKTTFDIRLKGEKEFFQIRIGIHTGSVIAGVVGSKKFQFDIWGDTVNLAARMEQACDAGMINISSATYEIIKNEFDCTYRGKVISKNKGKLEMFYVEEKK